MPGPRSFLRGPFPLAKSVAQRPFLAHDLSEYAPLRWPGHVSLATSFLGGNSYIPFGSLQYKGSLLMVRLRFATLTLALGLGLVSGCCSPCHSFFGRFRSSCCSECETCASSCCDDVFSPCCNGGGIGCFDGGGAGFGDGPLLDGGGPLLDGGAPVAGGIPSDVSVPPPGQLAPPPPPADYRTPTAPPPRLVPEPQASPSPYSPTRSRPRLLWGLDR